jgi:signal transduction histidine kinase
MEYQRQLRYLAYQLSLVEERERRRIAADLHDRVGQTLAISRIRLGLLKEAAASTEFAQPIEDIRKLIIEAIQDTRSLILKISSPILYELGIEAAIEWLAEQTQKEHDIQVSCETDGLPKLLDNDVRAFLFRAVSELLINVVKHAGASRARITTTRDGDHIRISVWDNGKGFDISKVASRWNSTDGFGLFSIRERLDHFEGFMEMESRTGHGAQITLIAPLKCDDR